MNNKEAEILGKVMEIFKLKKEIVQLMVPERTYKHLEVIGNEMKAMLIETLCDNQQDETQSNTGIKKVSID